MLKSALRLFYIRWFDGVNRKTILHIPEKAEIYAISSIAGGLPVALFPAAGPKALGITVTAHACSANREPMLNVPAPIPSPAPAGFAEIFDAAGVAAELEQLPALQSGNERE